MKTLIVLVIVFAWFTSSGFAAEYFVNSNAAVHTAKGANHSVECEHLISQKLLCGW